MPPPDVKHDVTPREIQLIKQWIEDGAEWSGHWAFEPVKRSQPPNVDFAEWSDTPIDRFILARLEAEKLRPSQPMEKHRLIRAVTFDLTGQPPAPNDVDDFFSDDAPDAYAKVVDRLMASPSLGERMAWDWLDAARYADTNGYQGDRERTMWPWRDWVIESFNNNLPYDEFTVWQLAGDRLPQPTFEQKLATGFCRNHMINGEGGRIAEENRIGIHFRPGRNNRHHLAGTDI